jgi:hypothetical protein
VHPTQRRLRRVWGRAIVACALYLLVALAVPRLIRGGGPQRARPSSDEAPEFIMPNGERRRAVVFTRPDTTRTTDRRGDRALLWWCTILATVTLAGAVTQTIRIRAEERRAAD